MDERGIKTLPTILEAESWTARTFNGPEFVEGAALQKIISPTPILNHKLTIFEVTNKQELITEIALF